MNDQAANRNVEDVWSKVPPFFVHLVLLTDRREDVLLDNRLALSGGALRPARPRRGSPSACGDVVEDIEPARVRRRARALALGDARSGRSGLASAEGEALRAGAEEFVRSALEGVGPPSGAGPGLLDVARRGPVWAAGEAE